MRPLEDDLAVEVAGDHFSLSLSLEILPVPADRNRETAGTLCESVDDGPLPDGGGQEAAG